MFDLLHLLPTMFVYPESSFGQSSEINTLNVEKLNTAIGITQERLGAFALQADYLDLLRLPFEDSFDVSRAVSLGQDIIRGDFSIFPKPIVISTNSVFGGYSKDTNQIFLSQDFLNNNDPNSITDVLIEEYGHAIDNLINYQDSGGDEGEIFSRLVTGKELSLDTLRNLKAENDFRTIFVNGKAVAIEAADLRNESDNNRNEANNVATVGRRQVLIPLTGRQVFSDSIDRSDTADVYKVTIDESGTFRASLTGLSQNAYLELYSNDTVPLIGKERDKPGTNDEFIERFLTRGDYFLRVSSFGNVTTNYNLAVSIDQAGNSTSDSRFLGGFNVGTRKEVKDHVSGTDTQDYYLVNVQQQGFMNLALRDLKENANLELLTIRGGLENVIRRSTNTGSQDEFIALDLPTGSYYVRVYSEQGALTNYSLVVNLQPPTSVSISATDANAREVNSGSADPGQFTVSRSGSTAEPLTVNYQIEGSATNGSDYNTVQPSVTIPRGSTSATIPINVINDSTVEPDEQVKLTLLPSSNTPGSAYVLGTSSASVNITDDDKSVINGNSSSGKGSTNVNGTSYGWELSKYDAKGKTNNLQLDPNKTTILVAHGRVKNATDGVQNLERLAKTAASTFSNAQVIFLDWRNASADTTTPPFEAGKRIGSVANDVFNKLKDLGLSNPNNLYFYGHSLGSLLLTKVAEKYGKIEGFASLDPAEFAEQYDLDNDGNPFEDELPDIKQVAKRSIALVASDALNISGINIVGASGDNNYAMTAQRSYIVNFGGNGLIDGLVNAAGIYHNAVVDVFTGMLQSGYEVNSLADGLPIRDNQWGQDAKLKGDRIIGNYDADGVIDAGFFDSSTSLRVNNLRFINSNGELKIRDIYKTLYV